MDLEEGFHKGPYNPNQQWEAVINMSLVDNDFGTEHVHEVISVVERTGVSATRAAHSLGTDISDTQAPPSPHPVYHPGPKQPRNQNSRRDARTKAKEANKGGGKGAGKPGTKKAERHRTAPHGHKGESITICVRWARNPTGCEEPCPQKRAHCCEICLSKQHRTVHCTSKPHM